MVLTVFSSYIVASLGRNTVVFHTHTEIYFTTAHLYAFVAWDLMLYKKNSMEDLILFHQYMLFELLFLCKVYDRFFHFN